MKEPNIIRELNQYGLEVIVEKYKLICKDYGHKVSLHYDQLLTPKNATTNECRGCVIEKLPNDKFTLMAMGMSRFEEYNENKHQKFPYNSCEVQEKSDGSLIQVYYDRVVDQFEYGTKMSAICKDNVSFRDKHSNERKEYDFNFEQLFKQVAKEQNIELEWAMDKKYTYVFELVTPQNKVVNNIENPKIVLLAARNIETLEEMSSKELDTLASIFGCKRPQIFPFKSKEDIFDSLKTVKLGDVNFEGYVLVAPNGERLKVKSNMYQIHHQYSHFKKSIESKWRFIDVFRTAMADELRKDFPEMSDEISFYEAKYNSILSDIRKSFDELKPQMKTIGKKDFYLAAQKAVNFKKDLKPFQGILHGLWDNHEISFEDALWEMDAKRAFRAIS